MKKDRICGNCGKRLGYWKKTCPPCNFKTKYKVSDGCWEWLATKNQDGYGRVSWGGRLESAHRVSWTIENGCIPKGLQILHKCDNPGCVRPSHLFIGTISDNMKDAYSKGRASKIGDKNGRSRLTWEIVRSIRRAWATGIHTRASIAKSLNVAATTVERIISGKRWIENG